MRNGIYFKIAGYVDLAVLIIFTPSQISVIINGFWVITQKPAILPYVLFFVTAAMLVGARHHRTQFWN
jgi:membrane protein DedA with SNARE-associated domain